MGLAPSKWGFCLELLDGAGELCSGTRYERSCDAPKNDQHGVAAVIFARSGRLLNSARWPRHSIATRQAVGLVGVARKDAIPVAVPDVLPIVNC
jgi:hypothetical protein